MHGAWDDEDGYCEGSLARLLEGAAGTTQLPSVKSTPGFLCGMEFNDLAAELSLRPAALTSSGPVTLAADRGMKSAVYRATA